MFRLKLVQFRDSTQFLLLQIEGLYDVRNGKGFKKSSNLGEYIGEVRG